MKTKTLIAMFLSGVLALSLTGCNDPIEKEPDIVEPGNGNGDDGNDDGGNDGGGNNDQIDPSTGTWENKDEDGDGVLDENDDFPFDKSKAVFPEHIEEEFNNNVGEANYIGPVPFRVEGVINQHIDIDDFKFDVTQEIIDNDDLITFIVLKQADRFSPTVGVLTNEGKAVQHVKLKIDTVNPLGAAINIRPKEAGQLNFSILDANGIHDELFEYEVIAFIDSDRDGVPDEMEQALGLNHLVQDTDGDGVVDGNEYYAFSSRNVFSHDSDNDSVPNWLDEDSDNDGIKDTFEKTTDLDADKLPAFIDKDSDNDGTSDKATFEADEKLLDSDGDSLINVVDIDDDNDGVLDIFDKAPLTPINYSSQQTNAVLTQVTLSLSESQSMVNTARPFWPITLHGQNLDLTNATVVVLKGDKRIPIVNERISNNDPDKLTIVVPNYESVELGGEPLTVFVATDEYKTNSVELHLLHPETPLIYSISEKRATPGTSVVIDGENLTSLSDIVLGEYKTAVTWQSDNSISFIVPQNTQSNYLHVENSYGKSNKVFFAIDESKSLQTSVDIPSVYQGLTGPFKVLPTKQEIASWQDLPEQLVVDIDETKVSIWHNEQEILSTILLKGQTSVELSLESFIRENVLTPLFLNKDDAFKTNALNTLVELAEYQEIISYYEQGLASDYEVFLADEEYALEMKLVQIRDILIAEMAKKQSQQVRVGKNEGLFARGQSVSSDPQRPIIHPEDRQDGIKVEPTRKGVTSLFDYDGYTEVQNSTPMYLSAAVYELDQDLNPKGTPATGIDAGDKQGKKPKVYSHINSMIDRDMLSPSEYRVFAISLWSADTHLKVCQFKNCLIEVLTPGFSGDPLSDQSKIEVSRKLFIRNLIDRVIIPSFQYVTEIVSKKEKLEDPIDPEGYVVDPADSRTKHITDVIMATPGFLDSIDDAFSDGKLTVEDQKDILKEMEKILDNEKKGLLMLKPGPIVSAIFNEYGFDIGGYLQALAVEEVKKLAQSFIPYIGKILVIYDKLKTISDGVNLAEAWYDLFALKTRYEFRVNWGLKLLKMSPEYITNDASWQPITLTGIGLCPRSDFWGDPVYPDIAYKDLTTGKEEVIPIENRGEIRNSYTVNESCTEAVVYLSTEIAQQLVDDSKVTVELRVDDLVANSQTQNASPNYLQLGNGLTISEVNPNPMYINTEVEIIGYGFAQESSNNIVQFRNAANELVTAEVVYASETSLTVLVPDSAVSGLLSVTVNGETVDTNVTIKEAQIMLTFGDNGNKKDDSFQLFIGDTLVDQTTEGQNKLTKTISLTPGDYSIKLSGITIPDNRATYYVCFSSNVEVLTGSTSRKVDIPDGYQFNQIINIRVNNSAVSQPVGCKFKDESLTLNKFKLID
ncbi:MAG: IPT/TIG domain-containing protein [Pseudomonadota bacterium]|nr:IPT/TIG domain-containing protein [Pseudomonadota bacterium]